MVNRWLTRANSRLSLASAASLLIGFSLFGQILGFVRTQVINGSFNSLNHITTDPYFAAFKIPDFFFYTIAAGALGVAFMPFLVDRLNKGDKESVWKITSSLLNMLSIIMAFVGLLLLLFPSAFLYLVVRHNLSPQETHQAIVITRLIAFNPLLFAISGILTAVQQTFGRFFFFAIGPIIYNSCIIGSVYLFRNNIGLEGLGIGAVAGAVAQLLIVLFGLVGTGFHYHRRIYWKLEGFKGVLHNLVPRSIDQGLDPLNSIVETGRAATLQTGSITIYENAYTLHLAPILLIGTTISTAAFPRLNERLASGRTDLFRRDFKMILRAMIWIILPIAAVTYFTRSYLARLIFKSQAPEGIAAVLGLLVIAIIFRTLYAIISRYFYAYKDTRTPLYVSIFTIALNIVLAFTLVRTSFKIEGLAIAQSIVAAVEVFILLIIMVWRDHDLFDWEFWSGIIRVISVTGFTMLAAFLSASFIQLNTGDKGFITLGAKFMAILIPTLFVHILVSWALELEEVQPVIDKLKKLILRPIRIQ